MKPVHHLLFGFILVMGFFLLFLPDQITWPIVFLAVVSGFLPDFDHREWIWKLIAVALFAGFFLFFGNSLLASFQGDELTAGAIALAAAAIISFAVYAAHPFTADVMSLHDRKLQFSGAEGWFLALYVLIVFAVTLSPVIALAALIGYSSHWLLDYIAYYTYFGRKNLVNYPHPEHGPPWQIRRLQAEKRAKEKAEAEAAEEAAQAKKAKASDKNNGKKVKKHGFLWGAGLTEDAGDAHDSHDGHESHEAQPGMGDHSLASDEQVMEEPEMHEEDAHGGSGAGH